MQDLAHYFGNDLSVSAAGDLLAVDGDTKTQQRILRRLLTNPGDMMFHPDYGAGLGQWVGKLFDEQAITALIRGQTLLESAVASDPAPVIAVAPISNGLTATIQYYDNLSQSTQVLSFDVNQ